MRTCSLSLPSTLLIGFDSISGGSGCFYLGVLFRRGGGGIIDYQHNVSFFFFFPFSAVVDVCIFFVCCFIPLN